MSPDVTWIIDIQYINIRELRLSFWPDARIRPGHVDWLKLARLHWGTWTRIKQENEKKTVDDGGCSCNKHQEICTELSLRQVRKASKEDRRSPQDPAGVHASYSWFLLASLSLAVNKKQRFTSRTVLCLLALGLPPFCHQLQAWFMERCKAAAFDPLQKQILISNIRTHTQFSMIYQPRDDWKSTSAMCREAIVCSAGIVPIHFKWLTILQAMASAWDF